MYQHVDWQQDIPPWREHVDDQAVLVALLAWLRTLDLVARFEDPVPGGRWFWSLENVKLVVIPYWLSQTCGFSMIVGNIGTYCLNAEHRYITSNQIEAVHLR